jgi:hypothetical protein
VPDRFTLVDEGGSTVVLDEIGERRSGRVEMHVRALEYLRHLLLQSFIDPRGGAEHRYSESKHGPRGQMSFQPRSFNLWGWTYLSG